MSKEELLEHLIAEIDLIMHDKDYRFENKDGTWFSRESCRDLTNEEVFEELKSELMQLNSQVEKIADLEKKLEITEKALDLACEDINSLYRYKTLKAQTKLVLTVEPFGFRSLKEHFKQCVKEMMKSEN